MYLPHNAGTVLCQHPTLALSRSRREAFANTSVQVDEKLLLRLTIRVGHVTQRVKLTRTKVRELPHSATRPEGDDADLLSSRLLRAVFDMYV